MYKILNCNELIKSLSKGDDKSRVYQENFDDDYSFLEFPTIIDRGEPLRFVVTKDEDNFYIEYDNYDELEHCGFIFDTYHEELEANFENYYSGFNYINKNLPSKLEGLIEEGTHVIFLLSNRERLNKDINDLKDFLIKKSWVKENLITTNQI